MLFDSAKYQIKLLLLIDSDQDLFVCVMRNDLRGIAMYFAFHSISGSRVRTLCGSSSYVLLFSIARLTHSSVAIAACASCKSSASSQSLVVTRVSLTRRNKQAIDCVAELDTLATFTSKVAFTMSGLFGLGRNKNKGENEVESATGNLTLS